MLIIGIIVQRLNLSVLEVQGYKTNVGKKSYINITLWISLLKKHICHKSKRKVGSI